MRFSRFVPLTALVLAAACARTPEPVPVPPPAPAPTPTPTPTSKPQPTYEHWSDAPATPGDWSWRASGIDSIAEFTSPQGRVLFQIACTEQRQVYLSMPLAGSAATAMIFRTETAERTQPANNTGTVLRTVIFRRDTLLDAIAFSKGRFAVEADGAEPLYLPAYPEISRVIEDCR